MIVLRKKVGSLRRVLVSLREDERELFSNPGAVPRV